MINIFWRKTFGAVLLSRTVFFSLSFTGCGELEPLDLGNITNYQPGVPLNLVTFTCDVGFHVSGQETAECQVSGDWLQDENVQCRSKYYQCGGTDLKITSVKSTMRKDLVEREEGDGYNLLVG